MIIIMIVIMDTLGIIMERLVRVRQCSRCKSDTEYYCYTCKHNLCLQCKERHITNSHEVLLYRSKHRKRGFTTQCKIRQCSQCQVDTEYYCNTCKHDLCLQCKERHITNSHKVLLYRSKHRKRGFTIQCKIRQCSQCQGDTEYYCNTCKHELCLQCKERHVTNVLTKHHKVVLYKALTKQCKIRKCSQCQGDTEYYCNTCEHDLCPQCKEIHVIHLDTIYHDVVIYHEKYEFLATQEICEKHPKEIYQKYCESCTLPVCDKCTDHEHHQKLDIIREYKTKRLQYRENIHSIRSETISSCCFVLAGIKTDIKSCHNEIHSRQLKMSRKAQRLKNFIDTVICEVKSYHNSFMINRLQKHQIKMKKIISRIENVELISEQSTKKGIIFFSCVKKLLVLTKKHTDNLKQHALLSLTGEINIKELIRLLNETQIGKSEKRRVKFGRWLKLMTIPVEHKSFEVAGIFGVRHIAYAAPDRIWINNSQQGQLILTNTAGDNLHQQKTSTVCWGGHTMNSAGDLIYIEDHCINKLTKDYKKSTLVKMSDKISVTLNCVYCSPSNADLLVGLQKYESKKRNLRYIVLRYNEKMERLQLIELDDKGQKLYRDPRYITENRNGDVLVSDWGRHGALVVTDRGGRHRFTYRGHPPESFDLGICGICTDALSHILVWDNKTSRIHIIDKDGKFLLPIDINHRGRDRQVVMSYDAKSNLLLVGSYMSPRVRIFRYIQIQDCLTGRASKELQDGESRNRKEKEKA